MDQAYEYAQEWSVNNNVEILNASPGTHLKAFKTIDFKTLF